MSETTSTPVDYRSPPAASDRRHLSDVTAYQSPFTRVLERYRAIFFVLLALLVVAPFNGQWRIGLDSSLYRGVADNLAAGHGYVFAGLPQKQIYPGLPYLMAFLEKLTGSNSVVPVLLVMNVFALLTLVLTYSLIRTRYPIWIATVVTCGVALNVKFVQQAHEVMTDTPFLLGCMMAMLGWEWLAADQSRARRTSALPLLAAGLFIAAVMRPTFWVLALALAITCGLNVLRRRERRSLVALIVLMAVLLLFAALDPRVRGLGFFQGGYEREFFLLIGNFLGRIRENADKLFTIELTESFFNEPLWYFGLPFALLLLTGAALVTRRQPLWGLQVFILTGIMLLLSDVPRYYMMVLPTLWLGFVLVLLHILHRLPHPLPDHGLFVMFSLANFLNLGSVAGLIRQQHQADFIAHYHDGDYLPLIATADLIRNRVPPDAVVIGPYSNVLTYLAGRPVLGGKQFGFDTGKVSKYPQLVAALANKPGVPLYMVGPHSEYIDKDPVLAAMILRGVIRPQVLVDQTPPIRTLAGARYFWLATAEVVVPTSSWKDLPRTRPVVLSKRAAALQDRREMTPQEKAHRELKAKRERKRIRAEREARHQRNLRKQRRLQRQQAAQRAATQPGATRPTTQPAPHGPQPTTRPAPAATEPSSRLDDGFSVPLAVLGMRPIPAIG